MSERVLVLSVAAAAALLILFLFRWYRSRPSPLPDRLDVSELGLELMTGCCAFVVFVTPSCAPCKAALRVVRTTAAEAPGLTEVTTVDAMERAAMATKYGVRTIPTVFLITASGHVVMRWMDVPEVGSTRTALAGLR